MKKIIIIACSLLACVSYAQEDSTEVEDWKLYKPQLEVPDTMEFDSLSPAPSKVFTAKLDSSDYFNPSEKLDFNSSKKGTVSIHKDARIDELVEFMGKEDGSGEVKMDGFRVQLFFDQDRDKVLGEKARFLNATNDVPAYMEWDAPNHYVRVGDYYTRQQALELLDILEGSFPSATIIATKINLPDLEKE